MKKRNMIEELYLPYRTPICKNNKKKHIQENKVNSKTLNKTMKELCNTTDLNQISNLFQTIRFIDFSQPYTYSSYISIKRFLKTVNLYSHKLEPGFALGIVMDRASIFEAWQNFKFALQLYLGAMNFDIDDESRTFSILKKIGFCLTALERFKEAEVYLSKAIQKNSNDSDCWRYLGVCLEQQEKTFEAAQCLAKSITTSKPIYISIASFCRILERNPELKTNKELEEYIKIPEVQDCIAEQIKVSESLEKNKIAALHDDPIAQNEMGKHYSENHNFKKAFYWFNKAARNGNREAQYSLCEMYYYEHGVCKNLKKVYEWCMKAALQNHPRAYFSLYILYSTGEYVEKDMKKAMELLNKSAELGESAALDELASLTIKD